MQLGGEKVSRKHNMVASVPGGRKATTVMVMSTVQDRLCALHLNEKRDAPRAKPI